MHDNLLKEVVPNVCIAVTVLNAYFNPKYHTEVEDNMYEIDIHGKRDDMKSEPLAENRALTEVAYKSDVIKQVEKLVELSSDIDEVNGLAKLILSALKDTNKYYVSNIAPVIKKAQAENRSILVNLNEFFAICAQVEEPLDKLINIKNS